MIFMIDSGSFSLWTKKAKFTLDDYIAFCESFPQVDYYVSLDIIPGSPSQKHTPSRKEVEECCKRGWDNYLQMCRYFPSRKVIPTFHKQDDVRWLDKYLSHGCDYIGIGGLATTKGSRSGYLETLRKFLFDGAGRPVCRVHGFALSSFEVLNIWSWYSVDSSTWQQMATWGQIWVPRKTMGKWDFSKKPFRIAVTPASSYKGRWEYHLESMPQVIKDQLKEYLQWQKIPLGSYQTREVEPGYELDRSKEEKWAISSIFSPAPIVSGGKVGLIHSRDQVGIVSSYEERFRSNALTMREVSKVVNVQKLYLAGPHLNPRIEPSCIDHRLVSFAFARTRVKQFRELVQNGQLSEG